VSDPIYRPRSASEIVDGTFRLYREHFVSFLTLSTLLYLPFIVAMIPMLRAMQRMAEDPMAIFGAMWPVMLISIFWYPIMWGAMTVAASERYLGRDIDAGEAVKRAFGKFGTLLGSMLIKWFVIIFGFFLIIPGFYFIARFFAVPATVMFENNGVGGALGRSGQLSVGHKGRILGTLALAWLILFAILIAFSMVMGIVIGVATVRSGGDAAANPTSSMLMQLPGTIAYILALPVIVITETLLYYDARIRHEGYDIELMNMRLEEAGAGATAR
jgi:hypothetical protein